MDPNLLALQRVSPRALEDYLAEIRRFDRLKREVYPTHASLKFPTSGPVPRFNRPKRELHPTGASPTSPSSQSSPPRRSTRYPRSGRAEGTSKRIKFEPMLHNIDEDPAEEPSEPATPIEQPSPDRSSFSPRSLEKKKSFSNLRLRFKRSAASVLSVPRKASFNNDTLGDATVLVPQLEYNLRGKHWLLAARQVGSAATSQWHPHHPFIWTSQNLWCTACTRYCKKVSWRLPRLSGGLINQTQNGRSTQGGVSTDIVFPITPYQGEYRDIPLVCALCKAPCCIHGAKKLEITQNKTRVSDSSIKSRPSPSRCFKIPAQTDAEAELAEIEASFAFGPDAESFVTCMQTGCNRRVCPACAARCAGPLCGLILCSKCWPKQEGDCALHYMVDVRVDIPPHPSRSPPPPPPPRSPPPPPPSRPPPPPPVQPPPIPPRHPKRLRRRSAPAMPLSSPGRTIWLSKSLPSLPRRRARTLLPT